MSAVIGCFCLTRSGTVYFNVFEDASYSLSDAQMIFPKCRIKRLYVNCIYNGISEGSLTVWVNKNGVNQGSGVTFSAGETGIKSQDLNLNVDEGDLIAIAMQSDGYVSFSWSLILEEIIPIAVRRMLGDGLVWIAT